MPAGEPYQDPDELPEEFQQYGREAKMAALDAYNGAVADGLPTGRALEMAHQAAKSVEGGAEQGISDETRPPMETRDVQMPRQGGGRPAAAGNLAQALRGGNRPRMRS